MHAAQAIASVDGASQAMARTLQTSAEQLAEVRASMAAGMQEVATNMAAMEKRVKACQ